MVVKSCKACGIEFSVPPSRQGSAAFCSRICYHNNQHLRHGSKTATCGNIVGQRFGRLVVVELVRGTGRYRCHCDCGNETMNNRGVLIAGRVKSCGCWIKDQLRLPGVEGAWRAWLRYLRAAAQRRGLAFSLTDDEVRLLCKKPCTYCGKEPGPWHGWKSAYLASSAGKQVQADQVFADSKVILLNGLDRADSTRGYEPNNVTPCCWRCNSAKSDLSQAAFRLWVEAVYMHFVQGG